MFFVEKAFTNKNEAKSEIENPPHTFRETNIVFQLI